jgi:uncharacterized Zn-binding protein involved in type VI secretion
MGLITRFYGPNAKGSKLTIKEMDDNLYYLQNNGVVGVDFLSGNLILTNPTGATLTTKIDRYNKNYIPSGETFTVPNGYQNFVYGDVIIEGTLNIEENGELVVLNGDIIISGGTIVGSGTTYSVTLPEFNTFVTSGNYNSTSKQITFNGNFGFTPFNVDLSGITVGGGLEGTNYIYVAANGTPIENATELQLAYDKAKTMSPSQPNRITIICGPGKYEFPNSSPFTIDTAFIDLVSLTGNRDVFLYTTSNNTNLTTTYNIDITTDNVFVKGVDASTSVWVNLKGGVLSSGSFRISNSLSNLTCENCKGGSVSFVGGGDASGTFTNCVGGNVSFGGNGTASGTGGTANYWPRYETNWQSSATSKYVGKAYSVRAVRILKGSPNFTCQYYAWLAPGWNIPKSYYLYAGQCSYWTYTALFSKFLTDIVGSTYFPAYGGNIATDEATYGYFDSINFYWRCDSNPSVKLSIRDLMVVRLG